MGPATRLPEAGGAKEHLLHGAHTPVGTPQPRGSKAEVLGLRRVVGRSSRCSPAEGVVGSWSSSAAAGPHGGAQGEGRPGAGDCRARRPFAQPRWRRGEMNAVVDGDQPGCRRSRCALPWPVRSRAPRDGRAARATVPGSGADRGPPPRASASGWTRSQAGHAEATAGHRRDAGRVRPGARGVRAFRQVRAAASDAAATSAHSLLR